jgi:hypothetical protein
MSQRPSGYARQPGDVYETPHWVTQAIVPYLRRHCSHLWDPANGPASKIAQVLRDKGFRVTATNDDFLTRTSLPAAGIDGIGTNPPYGSQGRLACQFIGHAIELSPVVAMLLRIDFDSGKTRRNLFRDCSTFAGKIVLLDRVVWFEREGAPGPSYNHAWYIWHRAYRGPPTIHYAGRPK